MVELLEQWSRQTPEKVKCPLSYSTSLLLIDSLKRTQSNTYSFQATLHPATAPSSGQTHPPILVNLTQTNILMHTNSFKMMQYFCSVSLLVRIISIQSNLIIRLPLLRHTQHNTVTLVGFIYAIVFPNFWIKTF